VRRAYYEPLFAASCARIGRGCALDCDGESLDIPIVSGCELALGDHVVTACSAQFLGPYDSIGVEPVIEIGSGTRIGSHVIFRTRGGIFVGPSVSIGSDTTIADLFDHPAGVVLASIGRRGIKIGAGTQIGSGARIVGNVIVGAGARIGNGCLVTADVPANGIVFPGTSWRPLPSGVLGT